MAAALTVALAIAGNAAAQTTSGSCPDSAGTGDGVLSPNVRAVEQSLLPVVHSDRTQPQTLSERMRLHGVPGISVAVIHEGRIDWARGWGVRDVSSCEPVTPETVFQAASISKSVAALAVLRLVERGKLELDADVNGYLRQWKLPPVKDLEPGFVTLRQLLSHTAGTTVHGFPGYPGGPLPSVEQILDGVAPAKTPPIRMELPPGKQFRYSGGGYMVIQQALADVTGEPYDRLVQQEVFAPLGMRHSSVGPNPSSEAQRNVANANGRPNRGMLYPELAAAAMWTTPTDLARLLIDVQASASGKASKLLKAQSAREMLARQTDGGAIAPGWGLGFALYGTGDARRFGHDGRNEGFESTMVAYVDKGEGIVVLTNGDGGKQLADEVVRAAAGAYGWTGLQSRKVVEVDVPAEVLKRYAGFYRFDPIQVWIDHHEQRLHARVGGATSEPLLAVSPTRFVSAVSGAVAEFESAADGNVTGLRIVEGGPPVTLARTLPPESALGTNKLFLRGSMNDWSTANPLGPVGAGAYAVEIALEPGEYEFKLASEDWSGVDLGTVGDSAVLDEATNDLVLMPKGANIRLTVRKGGVFRFQLVESLGGDPRLGVARIAD